MLGKIFQRFVEKSPVTVMVGSVLERVLNPGWLNELFDSTAERQYTRELLFSTVFDLMSQGVCGQHPWLPAADQASLAEIRVSLTAVYNNLNGLEPAIPAALVRYTAQELAPVITEMGESGRQGCGVIGPRLWRAIVWRPPSIGAKNCARPRRGHCRANRWSCSIQPGA
jgi:hypothetical protein